MCYRRLQIIMSLCDECFQQRVWPFLQFAGCLASICFLYTLIVFDNQLEKVFIVIVTLVLIATVSTCILILEMGSRPLKLSSGRNGILIKLKGWNNDSWFKRFLKSCQPIAIRIGPFHKMDKERSPAFIKFILQRTIFLVVQTKCVD